MHDHIYGHLIEEAQQFVKNAHELRLIPWGRDFWIETDGTRSIQITLGGVHAA